MTYLTHIEVDETGLPVPSPEMEQERRVAVFDLQEGNTFRLTAAPHGPYRLRLGMDGGRAAFDWETAGGESGRFLLSIGALSQTVRDYRALCDSYAQAVRTMPPSRIEEIDDARRAVHLEAARELKTRMAAHAEVDEETARRLFTLICAMTEPV